jgi:hypothetical protein
MSFVLGEINKKLLLKRFREQILFNRFENVDIETEILTRMDKRGIFVIENKELLNNWITQIKTGGDSILEIKEQILNKMEK